MKGFLLLLALGIATLTAAAQQPASEQPIKGPFSPKELQGFRSVDPIDTHTHVFASDPFIGLLQKLNLHILDILVVDDNSTPHRDLATQRDKALAVVRASHGFAVLCTSFDPYAFHQPNYDRNVIQGLNDDFAHG